MLLAFLLLAGVLAEYYGPLPAARPPTTSPSPAVPAGVRDAAFPEEPGADHIPFLHLRRGALIESIAFSAAYLQAAPREDCIVLPSPAGTRIGGVAVYTKADRLLLRSVTYGVVPLAGLSAADINRPDKILPAMAAAVQHAARLVDATAGESDDAQLAKAALAVSFFPSTLNEVDLSGAGSDQDAPRQKTRVLVLDWNQRHYLWNPAIGVIDVPVPVDPLTRTPYLCIQQPELPGSMLFVGEYVRLHPGEQAAVLLDPWMSSHPLTWFPRGAAVAAFTDGAGVELSTPYGNIPLPEATPADFSDRPRLTAAAFARYHRFLNERGAGAGPAPAGLIGDTNELQLKRAHFRLQVANARPGRIRDNTSVLVIDCGDRQCAYAPGHGAAYSGWLPPYQALLVDGIVFAGEYRRAHPGERVVVLAHPPAGRLTYPQGGVNAHVFYTKDGALWGHIGEDHVGEYRIDGASAGEIGDRNRLIDLCTHNQPMKEKLAQAAAALFAGAYRQAVDELPAYDGRPFGADAVLAQLRALEVPCRIVPERERTEGGSVIEYPAEAVVFRWAGETFVYAGQKVFRARARGYPPDLALE